ncbi:MAG TPA: hypothetical protein PKD55_16110 [Bellilinea sp.]|nr:hypothetical protein [Bellilinea sp.]
MQFIKSRFNYLFTSTKGLIMVAIAMIALTSAIWGLISGPMAEMGVRTVVVRILGMDLQSVQREGRIIILYHAIAMAVIAIEVYILTDLVPMESYFRKVINLMVTVGYLSAMIFGLWFAYFGFNWAFHGVYLFGLSLIFMAGVVILVAVWPWSKKYYQTDPNKSRTKSGVDLERVAIFLTAFATVTSAIFGAVPGAFFGNGFESFLAENIIRLPEKTTMQYAVIGHLHIMLALIAVMVTLLVGRWLGFKGILHKIAMPLMILGTVILTLGVWGVVTPIKPLAHTIIYVGATPSMFAALLLLIWSWNDLIKRGTAHLEKPTFGQKLQALIKDPLRFGPTWQMLFMNFTTSGLGIFMAIKLDEIFRVWPAREEKIELTGHWHVLSLVIATIIFLYYGDMIGLKGKVRQWFGWSVILFSDLSMAAITLYGTKRLYVSEAQQQPLVNAAVLVADIAMVLLLVTIAAVMGWRLIDLFKNKGRWYVEKDQELSSEVTK